VTFKAIVSCVGSVTITLAMKTWSSWVMWRSVCNETHDIRVYHHSLHITCPLFRTKTYIAFWMASCVTIYWQMDNKLNVCQMGLTHVHTHMWEDLMSRT
jgi:hypothetical protein